MSAVSFGKGAPPSFETGDELLPLKSNAENGDPMIVAIFMILIGFEPATAAPAANLPTNLVCTDRISVPITVRFYGMNARESRYGSEMVYQSTQPDGTLVYSNPFVEAYLHPNRHLEFSDRNGGPSSSDIECN